MTAKNEIPGGADFATAMSDAAVVPLWEWYASDANSEPGAERSHLWSWRTLEPLFARAVDATGMDTAERRVLTFCNPAYGDDGLLRATININIGMQILMPGERARPHRHAMNALRFVIEGQGATTIVDGKSCPMVPGDLILTPGWTWHEHAHDGDARVVWLDALDVPLFAYLDLGFFEPGPANNLPELPPDSAFAVPGFMPEDTTETPHSPLFRYPWSAALEALDQTPVGPDGARRLRYINPATGGPVMALIDCFLIDLDGKRKTAPFRTTSNAACLVVEGEGRSRVGGDEIAWQQNDVFTLPRWNWIAHEPGADGAKLFVVTDRAILDRLGLLRDEFGA